MIVDIPVQELIPQRPPFVFIDRLTLCDDLATETQYLVRQDSLLLEDGVLRSAALVENMAQTCAARLGYASHVTHQPVRIGYIGAVRDMDIQRLPRVGEMLTTRIEVREEVLGVTLVDASVRIDGEPITQATMKIALAN